MTPIGVPAPCSMPYRTRMRSSRIRNSTLQLKSAVPISPGCRHTGFPFMGYGFRNKNGKSVVAYWLAAHSLAGNSFPPLYATMSVKNTGIVHPVLIDILSGEIKRVDWKAGTTDTLELLPVKDSIMAITDEDYFDWPVLPEAPSSLRANIVVDSVKLSWAVHGGDTKSIVVERRIDHQNGKDSNWTRIATLRSEEHTSELQSRP